MFSAAKTSGPSGYNINNSLRFRASASAYLSRTPASAGNRQIMTYSFWVKRGAITGDYNLTNATTDASNSATLYFNSSNNQTFDVFLRVGATNYSVTTSQVFRDPSAWYHIVVAIDTTQATSSNRTKVYVNGSQVTNFLTANYVPQNSNLALNNNVAQYIGFSSYFDGYMAEVNFIDGQALTPSSFGSTNATTGVWQPAAYTGTYGTNGFYLKFSDIATTSGSNAGLGKDFSGNGNYWTTNNISVTSGTTYDAMTDSPTLTSATVANYCTLNPLSFVNSPTFSNGNLTQSATLDCLVKGTIGVTSGKWYWECVQTAGTNPMYGLAVVDSTNSFCGGGTTSWGYYANTGVKYYNNVGTAYGSSYTINDIIGVAFDADAGTLTFYKNNVSQGVAFTGLTGNIYVPAAGNGSNTNSYNFGQRPFAYTPPTGFKALNTYNLPDSTIKKGNSYMDATLWTGNGTTQTITGLNFKPDFVWIKRRNIAADHVLYDSVRTLGVCLSSNLTSAEPSQTNGMLTSFNSNGYGVAVVSGNNSTNGSTQTYVGWSWQAGQGSTSSNTSGSITSTVSVNTTAGFSIVSYTEPASGSYTVGHGLGVAPKMIILRERPVVTNWLVWHNYWTPPTTRGLYLNSASAAFTTGSNWLNSVTSSVFGITVGQVTGGGSTTIAYCFAEIAGFSKFGSYTGNGSTDGPFVYLGFRPKYILIKNASAAYSWEILDTTRNPYNAVTLYLEADNSAAEATYSFGDALSNGFKFRNTGASLNTNGSTYIYAAFAENPFKNALAR